MAATASSLGVAIFACVTMAQIAAHSSHPTVALLLVALAGAGLGFLPFNLPPASAYVGDSGAYVLGFILGTLSIRAATGPTDQIFIAVPLVALGYPILDLGAGDGAALAAAPAPDDRRRGPHPPPARAARRRAARAARRRSTRSRRCSRSARSCCTTSTASWIEARVFVGAGGDGRGARCSGSATSSRCGTATASSGCGSACSRRRTRRRRRRVAYGASSRRRVARALAASSDPHRAAIPAPVTRIQRDVAAQVLAVVAPHALVPLDDHARRARVLLTPMRW